MKFKIGDRVECVESFGRGLAGHQGTVNDISGTGNYVTIEFDDNIDGHDGRDGKFGHCWSVPVSTVKMIKKGKASKAPKIYGKKKLNIGQRVRLLVDGKFSKKIYTIIRRDYEYFMINEMDRIWRSRVELKPYGTILKKDVDIWKPHHKKYISRLKKLDNVISVTRNESTLSVVITNVFVKQGLKEYTLGNIKVDFDSWELCAESNTYRRFNPHHMSNDNGWGRMCWGDNGRMFNNLIRSDDGLPDYISMLAFFKYFITKVWNNDGRYSSFARTRNVSVSKFLKRHERGRLKTW